MLHVRLRAETERDAEISTRLHSRIEERGDVTLKKILDVCVSVPSQHRARHGDDQDSVFIDMSASSEEAVWQAELSKIQENHHSQDPTTEERRSSYIRFI